MEILHIVKLNSVLIGDNIVKNALIVLITLLILYTVNFYRGRRRYPPGPFPLPFVGSLQFCEL